MAKVVEILFCQAEDCRRDLVRCRGLGDVYKRQAQIQQEAEQAALINTINQKIAQTIDMDGAIRVAPGSYTQLTLPTTYAV